MNDYLNNYIEICGYLKKKGYKSSPDLIEFASFHPITTAILDEAIARAKAGERKTVVASDIQFPPPSDDKIDKIKRRWGKERNPVRKLVLWGWDKYSNPNFIIFFGIHEFEDEQVSISKKDIEFFNKSLDKEYKAEISPGTYNILKEDVKYIGYTIQRASNGHFPALIDFKLMTYTKYEDYYYNHRKKKKPIYTEYYLVNTKGLYKQIKSHRYRYSPIRLKDAAEFHELESEQKFSLPYFSDLTYQNYVDEIKKRHFLNGVFRIAESPNKILNLSEELIECSELVIEIMSNQNLFKRKRSLKVLIEKNPPKAIYERILEVGNADIISGLFLELGKIKNPILEKEAEELIDSKINWIQQRFATGMKRCAQIYLNSINSSLKEQRIREIKNILPKLELIPKSGRLPQGKRKRYLVNKKPKSMTFNEYVRTWHSTEWEIIGPTLTFESNEITDGRQLDYIKFKNLIQEAEVYKMPESIGKFAYFIDNPKFYYFIKSSGHFGFLKYLRRYIRRIIDNYANEDEVAFIIAMKSFFLSYKPYDIISGYRISSNFNKLLKYFTSSPEKQHRSRHYSSYYYRDRKTPIIKSIDFKYNRLIKSYENKIEIWKRYLKSLFEIAIHGKGDIILGFCSGLIRNHPALDKFLEKISPRYLVQLSLSKHYALSRLFNEKLSKILSQSKTFNHNLMFALMESSNTHRHQQAWEYFNRTNGKITPIMVVDLLLLKNLENWIEFVEERLNELMGAQYKEFILFLMNKIYDFFKTEVELPEEIFNKLNESTERINELLITDKIKIVNLSLDLLLHEPNMSPWIFTLFQNLIFSISYDDLIACTKKMKVDLSNELHISGNVCYIYLLRALSIGIIPPDSEILDILELGTPKMVKTLSMMIEKNKTQLKNRHTTLLLMFESEVASLNKIATEIFESLPKKEFNKMLSILIDSTEERVYIYAINKLDEIYGDKVPENLIIQMLEHGSPNIKSYISEKIDRIIGNLGDGNNDLFLYYVRTLIFLPNLKSKSKDKIYKVIPEFIYHNRERYIEVESILLQIGGSNIIKDSERALVALAKIKKGVE